VTAYRNDLALTYYNLGVLQVATGQADLATAGFLLGRDLLKLLVRDDPQRLDTLHLLAATWHELGSCYVIAGRRLDAVEAFQQAIAHQSLPFAKAPAHTPFRNGVDSAFLDHLLELGRVQADLGRAADALGTFERARKMLESRSPLGSKDLYDLACIDSRCSLLVAESGASRATAAQAQSQALADRAMDELRRARSAGYLDRTHLNEDRDLERLRGRADFQLLTMDLAWPADPFAR
jgi:tetratricopeptide (TPR) repeat protein